MTGGYGVFEGLVDADGRRLLLAEAMAKRSSAESTIALASDDEEVRGGSPARRFHSSPGGVAQDALYAAPWMARFLRATTGMALVPTGSRGTFTYYDRPGDHLAVHRDIEGCDVAVITCLADTGPAGASPLVLYPGCMTQPLSAIRAAPERGACPLRLRPGQTLVIRGGLIPHTVPPMGDEHRRLVSVLCYRAG